MLARINALSSQ
jgi:hypothetical protein